MTTLGTRMLDDIWPVLRLEGALSTASYKQRIEGSITSTSLISGTLSAGSTTSTGIEAILSEFNEREIDGTQVQRGDRMARFPQNILSVTPDNDDQMVIGSVTYRVIRVMTPTDGASYKLHLRES